LKRLVEPFYNGFRGTDFWEDYPANYPLAQQVFDQGGAVSYAHPGMTPVFEQASIKELPVDLALGQRTAMDVLSNNDENASMAMWYRLLNCGFRVPISAGTDSFTNVVDHYIAGGGRVYVWTGPRFDYAAWIDGFRNGRSFASNGPILTLEVDGKRPGDEIRLDAPRPLTVKAVMTTQVPVDQVDLVVNGRVAESRKPAGGMAVEFTTRMPLDRSSWIALRALGPGHRLILNDTAAFAHTSPIFVTVGGRPVREAADIRFYRDWVERLIVRVEKNGRFANDQRRAEIVGLFRKALDWYRAAESGN
jgi:TolB protein